MPPHPATIAFSIRQASWLDDRDALRTIRARVFVEEQRIPANLEWDEFDPDAIHLLAEDTALQPIGVARLLETQQISRMAVLAAWRNQGVGTALLRRALDIAREQNHPSPFLNAQVSAVPFYLHRGFKTEDEEFTEAGIPHRRMVLRD